MISLRLIHTNCTTSIENDKIASREENDSMELRKLEYHYNNNISNNIYRTTDIASVSGKLSHFSGSCSFLKFPELRPLREKPDDNARTDSNETEEKERNNEIVLYLFQSDCLEVKLDFT